MSRKVGPLSFTEGSSFQKPYSETTAELIDQEVRRKFIIYIEFQVVQYKNIELALFIVKT